MPVTKIVDPLRTVSLLLDAKWLVANTRGTKPTIATGWWDANKVLPFVSVTTPEEDVVERGISGGGVTQVRDGSLLVACWASRKTVTVDDAAGVGAGLKPFVREMWDEIDRIVTENQVDVPELATGGLNFIELGRASRIPDSTTKPPTLRWQGSVNYSWVKLPA